MWTACISTATDMVTLIKDVVSAKPIANKETKRHRQQPFEAVSTFGLLLSEYNIIWPKRISGSRIPMQGTTKKYRE